MCPQWFPFGADCGLSAQQRLEPAATYPPLPKMVRLQSARVKEADDQ